MFLFMVTSVFIYGFECLLWLRTFSLCLRTFLFMATNVFVYGSERVYLRSRKPLFIVTNVFVHGYECYCLWLRTFLFMVMNVFMYGYECFYFWLRMLSFMVTNVIVSWLLVLVKDKIAPYCIIITIQYDFSMAIGTFIWQQELSCKAL